MIINELPELNIIILTCYLFLFCIFWYSKTYELSVLGYVVTCDINMNGALRLGIIFFHRWWFNSFLLSKSSVT